jgi:hypothetical protein
VGRSIENSILFAAMISPPFLVFFTWKKFLNPPQPSGWKIYLDWLAILCTSVFFLVCLIAAFVIPQDVAIDNWASVAKWRTFSGAVVRVSPIFLVLALAGRKKTRLLSIFWILAVVLDCLAIDMMA